VAKAAMAKKAKRVRKQFKDGTILVRLNDGGIRTTRGFGCKGLTFEGEEQPELWRFSHYRGGDYAGQATLSRWNLQDKCWRLSGYYELADFRRATHKEITAGMSQTLEDHRTAEREKHALMCTSVAQLVKDLGGHVVWEIGKHVH
jgi:hypothetical protein